MLLSVVGDFSRREEDRVYVFLAFLFFIGRGNRSPAAALAFALAGKFFGHEAPSQINEPENNAGK